MILITGANGHLGKSTIDFLLKNIQPNQITAMVRDPKKAEDLQEKGIEIRTGDYFDYSSLVKAFKGIDKLLFVSSGTLVDRITQHSNVVKAAIEIGVKHILYTSVLNPKHNAYFSGIDEHIATENFIKESGIKYTFLRNAYYLDNIPWFIGNDFLQSGKIYFPAGNGKASFAARVNMAEAAAVAILEESNGNKIYELGANTAYSFYDIASELSDITNKKIEYIDIPVDDYRKELTANQVPQFIADLLIEIALSVKHNENNYPDPTLEKLTGRKPISLKEFLQIIYQPVESK